MGGTVRSYAGCRKGPGCITLQSAKLCARELFTTAEIAVSTHSPLDLAGTFGPRLEKTAGGDFGAANQGRPALDAMWIA